MAAEIGEYDVFPVDYLRTNIKKFEAASVNGADFRIAVSNKLIDYWNEHYGYNQNNHVVIPCTLDQKYFSSEDFKLSDKVLELKQQMGILDDDIVLVYSGSTAPWQSFALLEKMFVPLLEANKNVKVLFLSKETADNKSLQARFPARIIIKWVQHHEVLDYLACGDYGILVREQSDTNKVASPTKFAEYLYAGLPVLISENLGDFSDYVRQNKCGYVLSENEKGWSFLAQTSLEEKTACFKLAIRDFMKESEGNANSYRKLVNAIE
jgi:glycosyltransferase involved in cell wall biosynthesis